MRSNSLKFRICTFAIILSVSGVDGNSAHAVETAASLPSDCTFEASPASSPTNVLIAGTPVRLTASCASGDKPISFAWTAFNSGNPGVVLVQPGTSASYAVTPFNAAGAGIPMTLTVYTGRSGLLVPPTGCTVVQTPDTRFHPPSAGSTISLNAVCTAGGAATGCTWSDPQLGSRCGISVAPPDSLLPLSVAPFNAAGAANVASTTVYGSAAPVFAPNALTVAPLNPTLNGARMKVPQYVGAGDVLDFGVGLFSIPKVVGMGLCMAYPTSLGAPVITNIYEKGYIGGKPPTPQAWVVCDRLGEAPIPGLDTYVVLPWIMIQGTWPDTPLPIKLYDTHYKILPDSAALMQLGFGVTSSLQGAVLTSDAPLTMCRRPKAILVSGAVDGSRVAYNLFLSAAIPNVCGIDGTFPVALDITLPAGMSVASVTGNGVSFNGERVIINVPADAATTAVPFEINLDGPLPAGSNAGIASLRGGGNYTDGGTTLPSGPIIRAPGGGGGGVNTGGTILTGPPTQTFLLNVSVGGRGAGVVKSDVGNVQCPADCNRSFNTVTPVTLNATASAGSQFAGWLGACTGRGPCTLSVAGAQSVMAMFAADTTPLNADIDGNGRYDALTDGLMIARYLHGLTTNALTNGVLPNVTTALLERLIDIRPILDIDGNGQVDALTDGILLQRYLFGLRGGALLSNAVSTSATRTTAAQIEAYIQTLLP